MLAPSILSADYAHLAEEIRSVLPLSRYIHFDVMDGHFVPNISIGYSVLKSLKNAVPEAQFDAHLMVTDPGKWVGEFAKAGASIITFHFEAQELRSTTQPYPAQQEYQEIVLRCKELIYVIKSLGVKAGISIKPETPVEVLESLLGCIDLVLLMSVEPGFGGQSYMPICAEKARWLVERYFAGIIEIDGGINAETARHAKYCGVQLFVAGNYVFAVTGDERIARMQTIVNL